MMTAGHQLHHATGIVYDTDDGPRFASDARPDELQMLIRTSATDEHVVILDITDSIGFHIDFDYLSEADGRYWGVQNVQQGAPAPHAIRRRHHHDAQVAGRGATSIREKAWSATASTMAYVHDEPVKAMLIAAASGAVLMGVLALLARRSRN